MNARTLLTSLLVLVIAAPVAWVGLMQLVTHAPSASEWLYIVVTAVCCVLVLQRPVWGLYLFPFALFAIPSTHFGGVRFLSPPLLIAGATLVAGLFDKVINRKPLPVSTMLVLMSGAIAWHILYFATDLGNQAGIRMYSFIQGALMMYIASWSIDTPVQATRVMYAWILAWLVFSVMTIFQFIRWIDINAYSLDTTARITDAFVTVTFENPNVNIIALIGSMFVPVILEIILQNTKAIKRVQWLAVLSVVLAAIFVTFSRAGILGVVLSLAIWPFVRGSFKKQGVLALFVVVLCMLGLIVFLAVVSPAATRLAETQQELSQRIGFWENGLAMFFANPLLGIGPDDRSNPATHSYVIKSAMEFGIIYIIMFAGLILLLLYNGWRLHRSKTLPPLARAISIGITVTTIVAIPQAFFGTTFQTSMYTTVFWTLQVIQWIYLREDRIRGKTRPVEDNITNHVIVSASKPS